AGVLTRTRPDAGHPVPRVPPDIDGVLISALSFGDYEDECLRFRRCPGAAPSPRRRAARARTRCARLGPTRRARRARACGAAVGRAYPVARRRPGRGTARVRAGSCAEVQTIDAASCGT